MISSNRLLTNWSILHRDDRRLTLPDMSPCSAINKAVPEEPTATEEDSQLIKYLAGWVQQSGTVQERHQLQRTVRYWASLSVVQAAVSASCMHTLINVPELHFSSQLFGHVEGEAAGNSDKFKGLNGDSFTMPEWPPWLHSCQILLARPRPCVSIGSWPIPSSYRGTSRK